MKSLKIIIKLHKKKINDLKSKISIEEDLIFNLKNKKDEIKKSADIQIEFINKNPSFAFNSCYYFDSIEKQINNIMHEVKSHQQIIDTLKNELMSTFYELKKIEIFLKNRNIKESQKLAAEEVTIMNEIALNNYIKNN